jgi:cell wall-associated NlpC family hydrolase
MRLIAPLTAGEIPVVVAAARSLLTANDGKRVPFKHRGRSVRGVDCIGLIAYAFASVGREIRDRKDYGRDPVRDGLRGELIAHLGEPIPKSDMRPGDVLLMRWHRQGTTDLFNHVALVTDYPLGGLAIIHSYAIAGTVVEHRFAEPWVRRTVEVYR